VSPAGKTARPPHSCQSVSSGLTLVQLAVAFAVRHPAATSAIAGPRTVGHLDGYLAADGVDLPDGVLDRTGEIVPPGVTVNVADNMWNIGTTALTAASRRRPAAHPQKEP
jgi:hypothetical protein